MKSQPIEWKHILSNDISDKGLISKMYKELIKLKTKKNKPFFYDLTIYFLNYLIVQLQLSAFSPHHSPRTPAKPSPSLASTLPLSFVHVSFIVVPENPSPFSPFIPSTLPSGYCQIVLNFNDSGYILLACTPTYSPSVGPTAPLIEVLNVQ